MENSIIDIPIESPEEQANRIRSLAVDWRVTCDGMQRTFDECVCTEDVQTLRSRYRTVRNAYEELETLWSDIKDISSEREYVEKYTEMKNLKFNTEALSDRLDAAEGTYKEQKETTERTRLSLEKTTLNSSILSESTVQIKTKRPDLELPKFNGDITFYASFMEQFESVIGSDEKLNLLKKFNFLIGCCEGDVKTLLGSLPIKAESYEIAKGILKLHYGNTEIQKTALRNKIRNFEATTKVFPIANVKSALENSLPT